MSIAVIIVNYKLAVEAVRAARSALSQGVAVEVWVVDNSCLESEAAYLQRELGGTCQLLINDRNLGFGAACNLVYARTRQPFVLLLNPDAYLLPEALPQLLAFLESHPQVAACGPRIYWDDSRHFLLPPNLVSGPWNPFLQGAHGTLGGLLTWSYSLYRRREALHCWHAQAPIPQESLSGGHALLRRSALERVGGLFDPQFFLYYEDTDLFLRLRQAGFELYCVPAAEVVHRFGSCAPQERRQKSAFNHESHLRFMDKHYQNHWAKPVGRWFQQLPLTPWQPRTIDYGVQEPNEPQIAPPSWPIPKAWRDAWLLELSPNPYLLPAAGYLGSGPQARFPEAAWRLLPPGPYFVRLGPARTTWLKPLVWHWERQVL